MNSANPFLFEDEVLQENNMEIICLTAAHWDHQLYKSVRTCGDATAGANATRGGRLVTTSPKLVSFAGFVVSLFCSCFRANPLPKFFVNLLKYPIQWYGRKQIENPT
jgi:hypothetical protein